MFATTRRRNRRCFQPSLDALAQRIAPTVFLPSPGDQPVAEVTYPDCNNSGNAPRPEKFQPILLARVSYPDSVE